MPIETIDRRAISEAEAREIATLLQTIWPRPWRTVESRTEALLTQWASYTGPEAQYPRSFLFREEGRVIAHASAYPRTIATAAGEMTVLALARVCTHPQARGRKLGRALVQAAFQLVDEGTFPVSLFQTSYQVRPFYERLGAVVVPNRFVNSLADDPAANPWWDEVVMRYPDAAGWPDGQIDLMGPGW